MSDDDDDQALVPRDANVPAPVPPIAIAKSLASVGPREFVHIDASGQVRSPARFRAIQTASYVMVGLIGVAVPIAYAVLLGLPGLALGGALSALTLIGFSRSRKLQKGARLLRAGRLDEAEPLLRDVATRARNRRLRGLALYNLAAVASRRGQFDQALEHQRGALVAMSRRRREPLRPAVEYSEVITLVNLDRVKEAREVLDRRHPTVPEGDYFQFLHWIAEGFVVMAEGRHTIDDDELHSRARVALGMSSGASLLALLAWAYHASGDLDQAWHLLREALDRPTDIPLDRTMPRLHAWMQAHAAEAAAAADPSDA